MSSVYSSSPYLTSSKIGAQRTPAHIAGLKVSEPPPAAALSDASRRRALTKRMVAMMICLNCSSNCFQVNIEFLRSEYCVDVEDCLAAIGLSKTSKFYAEAADKPIVTEAGKDQIPGEIS